MAEARREVEEGQRRDLRDVRNRPRATDPERTKPDHLHSSQGPLSSIRAAIKRTRTNAQSDHTRDRRRPEITIVSAEPLAGNNWISGTSVVLPRPPQSGWSADTQTVSQPPPSYDQVIQEKSQEEHIVKPTAAPRRSTCTTTSATQTDPVREDTSQTALDSAEKRPAGKKPQKPQRPSLPKAVDRKPATETVAPSDKNAEINTSVPTNTEDQRDSKSDVKQPNQADSTHTFTRSVTVHWDVPTKPLSATADETTPSSSDSKLSQRPVPLPRTKSRKQATTEEDKVQTLVKLSESRDSIQSDPEEVSSNKYLKELLEVFSVDNDCEEDGNIVNQSDEALQGEDAEEMNTNQSQRNFQARIQAFESQARAEEGNVVEPPKPELRPRKSFIKPPVAAKPSVALKPQFKQGIDDDQNVSSTNLPQNPTPGPRPQPPKKPVGSIKEELQTLLNKAPIPNRSRPSVLTRDNNVYDDVTSPVPSTVSVNPFMKPLTPNLNINNHNPASMFGDNSTYEEVTSPVPPTPPVKPFKEPLKPNRNINNHNPASMFGDNSSYEEVTSPVPPTPPINPFKQPLKPNLNINNNNPASMFRDNNFYDEVSSKVPPTPPVKPFKEPLKPNLNINNHNSASMFGDNAWDSPSNYFPVKPQCNVDSNEGSFTRQSVTRRPTTIRVPSKTGSFSDNFQDSVPPLPVQKAVGYLQSSTPTQSFQESHQYVPEPSLPPRRLSTSKPLPPRPPPAKTGPGRPPPFSPQATGRSQSSSWEASPKPQQQKPQRKGPVLPPRPNPGHRLYNSYTLQVPHGIASFDYFGSHTGELSFQKNEVLLLLEEIDHNTFECQVGDTRGRVHNSRMKIITPLASVSHMSPPQDAGPADSGGAGYGLKVKALHDFIPEGQGELALRAGDVVTMVEQVDSEWYKGSCRGSTGFFPINYVKVLSNSPKPLPERKVPPPAKVSGPRCMARFDFEGEHIDELSFSEGDVIQLKEYIGQDWARGQIGVFTGIFPLNFVEVIEDLPPPPSQQQQSNRIALPGMAASRNTHSEVAKPAQASQSCVEWGVALYDFAGNSDNDLSFQQGDSILITEHIDDEWSCGQLNGREGMFPRAYVETSTGQQSSDKQQNVYGGGRARARFDFESDCDEELSLKVGDIITNLESIDEEWFLGDLRGKRALVPKNYVEVLE
ncbi:SH3 domain-containing protein 19 isoform X1 [Micropterus salmoides]|uniref:SH3 domain-containing protein 19 isoform X1 n=1 Tax=Micropterus salmoides TaxID=27706 RepID=UPI0018EE2293|nr:SH3 domain-containing protein 19 isoform X1 [Micropterus salmoides]